MIEKYTVEMDQETMDRRRNATVNGWERIVNAAKALRGENESSESIEWHKRQRMYIRKARMAAAERKAVR